MSDYELTDEKQGLSEYEERRVKYDVLTPGFIRKEVHPKLDSVSGDIVDLCTKFVKPVVFGNEADDPINFISDTDKRECDKYKEEGNQYLKAEEYNCAIIKYTTALRFNPNNHLVYSNRAYCYFHLEEYDDANKDIKECLRLKPAFSRGWYQYAELLEKDGDLLMKEVPELTALAWQRAWTLVIMEKNQPGVNACFRKKHKFWKSVEDNDAINEKEIEKFVEDFWKKPYDARAVWDSLLTKYGRDPEIKRLLQKYGRWSPEWRVRMLDIAPQETVECITYSGFSTLFEHSKYREMVERNAFQRAEVECHAASGAPRPYDHWFVGWSSTPEIEHNKRVFAVHIRATDILIHEETVMGKPTAEQVIDILYQAMVFTSVAQVHYVQPVHIRLSWCMHDEFEEIQQAIGTVDVECELQSEMQNFEERAAIMRGEIRRAFDGYTHLPQDFINMNH